MSVSFLNIVPNITQNHVEMLNGVFSCRIKRLNGTRCPATVEICCWNAFRAAKKTLANKWVRNICSKDMPAEEFSQKKTCTKYCVFFPRCKVTMHHSWRATQILIKHLIYILNIYIYTITWLDLTHDLNLNIYIYMYTYIYIYTYIYDQVKYGNFEKNWITWEDDWKVHSLSTPGRLYTYYIYIMSTLD